MATTTREFRLPDPGEGLTEAEIVSWRVAPGDTVQINDVVLEIETAKALVELPSPYAGTVVSLLAAAGDVVPVGTPVLLIEEAGGSAVVAPDLPDVVPAPGAPIADLEPAVDPESAAAAVYPPDAPAPAPDAGGSPDESGAVGSGAVLVGYGTAHVTVSAGQRRRRWAATATGPTATTRTAPTGSASRPPAPRVLAKPPVRRLARDLGLDLADVPGSGPGGSVTREDVLERVSGSAPATPSEVPQDTAPRTEALNGRVLRAQPVLPQPGDVRIPVRGVRRATAEAMVLSSSTAPHVTEWVQVDVTPTIEFVGRMRQDKEFVGLRVSPLLVVAKAVCLAARRNPGVNATWDDTNQDIVLRERVNLGIAAATVRGLVVPVIHGADAMHMPRLAQELTDLVATAREGRLQPHQLTGGTVTITNVGVFGVDGGTPILPPGQAAIITMGQIRLMPWVVAGEVVPRHVATLSVSFDHRLVDGELGSSFLTDVAAVLADPARGLIWA